MPELPDVEVFKKYIDSTSLHQRIQKVDLADMSVIKNIQRNDFVKNLEGQTFERTFRHGKNLFLKLSGCNELLLHFGMTGFPDYYKKMIKHQIISVCCSPSKTDTIWPLTASENWVKCG